MGLVQESRAEKALEELKKLSAPNAIVRRNGLIKEIPVSEVVPGDIIILETGNFVPADCRILNCVNLKIEESALTGETVPSTKDNKVELKSNILSGDMVNMAFSTTTVTNGRGEAVVCETGMKTKVGQIASLILSNESPETPLQKKLRRCWKKIGRSCPRNLPYYFHYWNFEKNSLDANVHDFYRSCCSCNSRRTPSNCYYFAFNWCY